MNIKVKFLSLLSDITGTDEISISVEENSSVRLLLEKLNSKFGENFERTILDPCDSLNKYIILGLNGKDIRQFDELNTLIHEGDELAFLPAIAGG